MACQERPHLWSRAFTLDMTAGFFYSGILSGYMITNSALTFPQFLMGIVHFFAISNVDKYKAFKR